MKVLEEGGWRNPWSKEVQCSEKECGAKLLVDEKDVKPVDYGNGYYVNCPICDQSVNFNAKDIPLRMRRELDKKRKCGSSSSNWD